ncbi:IclR family transcriptional regulator [Streptomyces sp. AJS327]|uniref:IclR family transcriptional regulator n=1 Tax=Streptomyces sp. AJS327 TaxID=2545265 RepID=UPI0015DFA9C8|nr:IclR family transcriptional regulator [Streptomyces sp. AJS327]MBA0052021.1 IclR family transcriptional regulator [Streptomyces sp. AJS327]
MTNSLDERYRVRSVSRAAEILEHLASAGDALTVTEVTRAAGGSKSSVFSTLQTLEAHGLVSSEGEGPQRRYSLGLALARYGEIAVGRASIRDIALPELRHLTEETGLSSRVAKPEQGRAVIVGRVDAPGSVRFDLHMGQRELPHSSGLGKAVTAERDDDAIRELLEAAGMPARTRRTLTDPDALLAELAEVRRRGYAIDDEEDADGVYCVGAAVRDHRGACAGAISVTGLKLDVSPERLHELGERVRESADRVSTRLGWG